MNLAHLLIFSPPSFEKGLDLCAYFLYHGQAYSEILVDEGKSITLAMNLLNKEWTFLESGILYGEE
jgi:hypothetical protein